MAQASAVRQRVACLAASRAVRRRPYSPGANLCGIIREPSDGTTVWAWRSLAARIVRDDEVGGSNPLAPTITSSSARNASARPLRSAAGVGSTCIVLSPRTSTDSKLAPRLLQPSRSDAPANLRPLPGALPLPATSSPMPWCARKVPRGPGYNFLYEIKLALRRAGGATDQADIGAVTGYLAKDNLSFRRAASASRFAPGPH